MGLKIQMNQFGNSLTILLLIDENTLYQASYGVGSTDSIYRIRDFNGTPQGCIQNFDRLEKIIEKGIPWPNEIARVPDRIMHDGKKWYTVAAGFNTPGKVLNISIAV